MTATHQQACELCDLARGDVLYKADGLRVILVDDAAYPGFCRVIWNAHVAEMTDLAPEQRASLMEAVWQVEQAVRQVMRPHKVNLASLGNMVPHLHWHIIPRYQDDAHFPSPVWAQAARDTAGAASVQERVALLPALRAEIIRRFTS
jgi:diadenosine tetraphosphate (Ap4A) HIT family hydrolase